VLLLARLFPGPNYGMAYAVAPIEDKYKVVPTTDPLRDAHQLQRRGERVLILYSLSTPLFVEIWQEVRKVASKYPVVAGGPHAVGDPITLLKLGVKYVVVGDGEAALPAIVERERRRAWRRCPPTPSCSSMGELGQAAEFTQSSSTRPIAHPSEHTRP